MAQEWYYSQGDEKVGPVSVAELKQAAADGRLRPSDLVWTDGMADWKEAGGVKGLWPAPPTSAVSPPPSRRAALAAESVAVVSPAAVPPAPKPSPFAERGWLIGVCLLVFYPVGLILLWRHPRLTNSTKWTVSVVGGVWFAWVIVSGQLRQKAAHEAYAEADRAWASGDKTTAAGKYRKLLDDGESYLTDDQKPLVYGRLIDFDAGAGDSGAAVKLAEKALERRVEPSVDHPAGRAAVAEAKRKQPPPSTGTKRPKKSDYTLPELRDMFPVPGTTSKDVYDTLGKPDLHDPAGFRLHYSYKKLCGGKGVMFTFEDGNLVSLDTLRD